MLLDDIVLVTASSRTLQSLLEKISNYQRSLMWLVKEKVREEWLVSLYIWYREYR